jgi:hypothetical protein
MSVSLLSMRLSSRVLTFSFSSRTFTNDLYSLLNTGCASSRTRAAPSTAKPSARNNVDKQSIYAASAPQRRALLHGERMNEL